MSENSKCFSFSVLGWGHRVIYNSDILEKLRPPMGFQKSHFEFHTFLFQTLSEIFAFFKYDASSRT